MYDRYYLDFENEYVPIQFSVGAWIIFTFKMEWHIILLFIYLIY